MVTPVANAEAAVVVVDESVLALGGWNLGDPLSAFYPGRSTNVDTQHLRDFVLLDDPARVRLATRNRGMHALGSQFGGAAPGGGGRWLRRRSAFDERGRSRANGNVGDGARADDGKERDVGS